MKNQIRRILTFTVALMLAFGISGCGGNESYTQPYQIKDKVKENIMWNTNTLFQAFPSMQKITDITVSGISVQAITFDGMPYKEKATSPFAYLGVPTSAAPKNGFPAIILMHGGDGFADSSWVADWVKRGYVAIAIDGNAQICDENGDLSELNRKENPLGGAKGYGSVLDVASNVINEDTWTYYTVGNLILANNLLRARKDVNPNKIGITGISWGGYLTAILSGIDKRFAFMAPIYGAGCLDEDTSSPWSVQTLPLEQKARYRSDFDPISYLPYATRPILFVTGATDAAFPISLTDKSYKTVVGKQFYSIRKDMIHSQAGGSMVREVENFAEHIINGKSFLKIEAPLVSKENISLKFSQKTVKSAKLVYSKTDSTNSRLWKWEETDALISGDKAEINIPIGTKVCFLVLTDSDNLKISTNLMYI